MKLVIFTTQVSSYHNARYVGATKHIDDVHVISSVNAGDFPELLAKSIGKYTLHKLYNGREEYAAATASGQLAHCIKNTLFELQPDAIATAGWTAPESLAALEFGRENNIPIIVMSESQADDAPRSFFREIVKKRVVSQFDAALVGGPPHAEYASNLGIPRERIHFGYNAVDNAYFEGESRRTRENADAARLGYNLPEKYILASARFIKKKNLPKLIAAYSNARRKLCDPPDLVILGDGPERSIVENAIHACKVGNVVHLPGFRDYNTLPTFYALSEAFIHVSTTEQWGLVINEAMASAVPVIASQPCGAARTVIKDGVSGLLADVDIASISHAIVHLFSMTSEERSEIGSAGQLAIRNWGPERFGAGIRDAVASAQNVSRQGRIAPWDRLFLKYMQQKLIKTVY